jgi:hypothetical protein
MVAARSGRQAGGMPRLLVLWSRPAHLSAAEAERWARGEIRALLADDGVRSAELTRLENASPRHESDWKWLLELQVAGSAGECLERGPCAAWLGDLRLLGMRPTVIVAGDEVGLEEDG